MENIKNIPWTVLCLTAITSSGILAHEVEVMWLWIFYGIYKLTIIAFKD